MPSGVQVDIPDAETLIAAGYTLRLSATGYVGGHTHVNSGPGPSSFPILSDGFIGFVEEYGLPSKCNGFGPIELYTVPQ
jgi:hypothetical protein